jgi:quercetin dioxygenase-like cupin family protein
METKRLIKKVFAPSLITIISFLFLPDQASAQTNLDSSAAQRTGQSPSEGFFTGGAATVVRIPTPANINCGAARVTFQPGTRTIWHAHAGGQFIVVTSGTAWYQEKGKAKQIITSGDAIVCSPGIMHWHGASPDGPMTHWVATPNLDRGGVTAGDAVTDKEYLGTK